MDVFYQRSSTGSGHFQLLGSVFFLFCSHFCAKIYLRITTLSHTDLIASRNNYKRKTSLPVDARASLRNA